jgi:NTP pyrophosphatase (non-canonical NTP hydrolase)
MSENLRELIYAEIDRERQRQDAKWGFPRNDLDVTDWVTILTEEVGEAAEAALEFEFDGAPIDPFIKELIHTAAVAVSAIEHYGRGGTKEQELSPVIHATTTNDEDGISLADEEQADE